MPIGQDMGFFLPSEVQYVQPNAFEAAAKGVGSARALRLAEMDKFYAQLEESQANRAQQDEQFQATMDQRRLENKESREDARSTSNYGNAIGALSLLEALTRTPGKAGVVGSGVESTFSFLRGLFPGGDDDSGGDTTFNSGFFGDGGSDFGNSNLFDLNLDGGDDIFGDVTFGDFGDDVDFDFDLFDSIFNLDTDSGF